MKLVLLQVGLEGEYLGLDKVSLANSSLWIQGSSVPVHQSLIWYKVCRIAWFTCFMSTAYHLGTFLPTTKEKNTFLGIEWQLMSMLVLR